MPKEAAAGSSQGGLVYLKYTFRYRDRFDKQNDEWLSSIEATSDGKKRLNRVFDVIGFVYPDYTYPPRKQGKKRKNVASAISVVPKGKKIKVLTHRPRYIETATVPRLSEGASSTTEAEQTELLKVPAAGPVKTPKDGAGAKA
jgi:hypothetical protein